jgi:hypothetical protein
VATISSLLQRLSRKSKAEASVKVTAFGFTVGSDVIAWQSVSEIWGYKVDLLTTDEAFIEFVAAGQSFAVSEEAMGFEALESAMVAAFPSTAAWREVVLHPAFAANRTLLYRRA